MNRTSEHWLEYYANTSSEEKELIEKVMSFGKWFNDMKFSDDNDDLLNGIVPEELENFDYCWFSYRVDPLEKCEGYYNHKKQVLVISDELKGISRDSVILHEMIHLHEDVINELPLYYHDILYWKLYSKLKEEVHNLDELIKDSTFLYENQVMYDEGGLHDIVFFLKSLELDVINGYTLGTVFGYGKLEDIVKT